jgi:uncharacterized membrane protein YeaQ/YmgE (transglycosylase-associated protein family)
MGLIITLVLGGLVGWLASKVMGTDGQMGVVANVICGVVGAFLGGWIAHLFGSDSSLSFSLVGLFWSFVGACVLIYIVSLFSGNTRSRGV